MLKADLLTRARRGHRRGGASCHTWQADAHYNIVATDQWGDRAALYGDCRQYAVTNAVPGFVIPFIRLRTATARMLQNALAR